MTTKRSVRLGRVYDQREDGDGTRVLVDRLWPRGMRKDDPRLDEWSKQVAPSDELRRWYGHREEAFDEFADRYRAELVDDDHREALDRLFDLAGSGTVTLLTATKQVEISQAAVLAEVLRAPRSRLA